MESLPKKGSGGLLQMQLVLLASNKKETPRVLVDTIKIFNNPSLR